jgi:hypothetical protein
MTGISVSAAEGTKAIYFAASTDWEQADARFAVYSWSNGSEGTFASMTKVEAGIYTAQIPSSKTQVIFVRMNPATADNNCENVWNQTADLTIPADKNCFKVNAGEWNGAQGTWSTYGNPVPTTPVVTTTPVPTTPVVTTTPVVSNDTIYFAAGDWTMDGARFAVYTWVDNAEGTFISMTKGADGLYTATLPAGNTNVIFTRMNPANNDNNWDNVWNQTTDLVKPADKNCFTVNKGEWTGANGTWSYVDPVPTTAPVTTVDPVTTRSNTKPTVLSLEKEESKRILRIPGEGGKGRNRKGGKQRWC